MKIKFFFIIWCLSLLSVIEAQGESVTFKVRSWDAVNKQVVTTTDTKNATVLSGSHENDRIALGNGYYVVNSHTQYKVLNITGNDVHLILSNGAELNCAHVKLKDGYKLHIHDVSDQSSGKLIVENHKEYTKKAGKRKYGNGSYTTTHGVYHTAAGIGTGGSEDGPMGSLYVHSGTVKVYQGGLGAAIGGGLEWGIGKNSEVTIFGGIVETHVFSDNYSGAGIGGGMKANQGGPINIYGGTVVSMIDGDWQSCSHGAGIGGGGWDGNGGTVNIWGGHVIAIGGKDGCGIGGADGGKGGDVHIYGGTVEARGGEKCSAIGGYRGKDKGTITFADNLKVTAGTATRKERGNYELNTNPERVFTNAEREAACQYRTWTKVEACLHTVPADGSDKTEAIYYTVDNDNTHTKHCRYCNATWKESHSGETCVCGKFSIVQIGIHNPGTTENTYAVGILKIVGAGKKFTMPACSVPEGYEFKGWEKDPTEENENKWCHTPDGLVQPQTSITAEAGMGYAQYYARFAKVYTTSWTWIRTAGGVQATVTIQHKGETVASETSGPSNTNLNITSEYLTETMTVDDQEEEIIIGTRYNATCNWTNSDGHTYEFTDSYDVVDDLTLQNGSDNTDNISDNILCPVNVELNGRTLYKDSKWNTLCLPFDIYNFKGTPLEGATVMTLDVEDTYGDKKTGYNPATGTLSLYFEKTDWIEAGVPYLVKWVSGDNIESPVFNNFTIFNDDPDETKLVSEDGKVSFVGNYDPVVLTGGDKGSLYLGANNKLYWPSANKTVNAFRAIFKVDTSIASEVRSFEMNFDGDTVTGIVSIGQEKGNNRANRWYDLQGRQISNSKLSKGLYIHNGQVVVVK